LNELLHRRLDIEDCVDAHLVALERAPTLGFGRYIITATTPFRRDDVARLRGDAPSVVTTYAPAWREVYSELGWRMAPSIGRVYDNTLAREQLRWLPRHDFKSVLQRAVQQGGDIRSELARTIGLKGYHPQSATPGA
jgi:UDP-glucose 4-epimerase